MVFKGKRGDSSQANRKSYDKSNVWCEIDGLKNTEKLMVMLGLKETIDKLAKANSVRCHNTNNNNNNNNSLLCLEFYIFFCI